MTNGDMRSPQLLSAAELANVLRIPIATIHRWRSNGNAPKAVRVGRHLRFDMNDVQEWMEERKS